MIQTKKDLRFYVIADRIMNGLPAYRSIREFVMNCLDRPVRGGVICYLRALRHYAYYKNNSRGFLSLHTLPMLYWHRRLNKLSLKLCFSIGVNSLGYGVVIPHNGTIVVNENARIGNFAVLHTCTCVAGGEKIIGDYFYLSSGCQIVGKVTLGDGVSVASHSLVNKSAPSNCLIAGAPAELKRRDYPLWIERDGDLFVERCRLVEKLKQKLY